MRAASPPCPADARSGAPETRALGLGATRPTWPVALLGVAFENVALNELVPQAAEWVQRRAPRRIEVVTAGRLLEAQCDLAVRHRLSEADAVVNDSATLCWAARWLGNPLRERIRRRALVGALGRKARQRGWRVFVLGDTAGAYNEIVDLLGGAAAVDRLGGWAPTGGGEWNDDAALSALRQAKPDLVFVASATPQLDAWIAGRQHDLAVPLCVHLPADAPGRDAAPSSHRRTLRDRARMAAAIFRQLWHQRRHLSPPTIGTSTRCVARAGRDWVDVDAGESLTRGTFDREPAVWRHDAAFAHCALDVSHVRHIDATGLGWLARCRTACRRTGRHFVLIAPTLAVRRALAEARLLDQFETAASREDARRLVPSHGGLRTGLTRSLTWCGEIIAANAEDVWEMTCDYVRTFVAQGATLVIIDLARLRFVDSAGAALMVRVKRWARELRTEVLFTHAQPAVQNVLRITSTDVLVLEGGQ